MSYRDILIILPNRNTPKIPLNDDSNRIFARRKMSHRNIVNVVLYDNNNTFGVRRRISYGNIHTMVLIENNHKSINNRRRMSCRNMPIMVENKFNIDSSFERRVASYESISDETFQNDHHKSKVGIRKVDTT